MPRRRASATRTRGLDARITRRDFLDATLLAVGGVLLAGAAPIDLLAAAGAEFDGPGGLGDYARANGNTWAVMEEGHWLRGHAREPIDWSALAVDEAVDCAIVGGGISGLAAALFLQRESSSPRTCLVLEDHEMFGGLARRNEFEVNGERLIAHQASAMYFPPLPGSFLADFYPSIGIPSDAFEYQPWGGRDPELPLGRTPYFGGGPSSAFYFGPKFGVTPGRLLKDPWGARLEGAPIPDAARRELLAMRDASGVRAKWQPKAHGDADARRLDGMSLEDHLVEAYGLSRETIRTFLSPVTGGGSGLGADALSAYADYAADVLLPWQYDKGSQMFPGGNAGVARHLVKALLPDALPGPATLAGVCAARLDRAALDAPGRPVRLRHGCTVVAVEHAARGGEVRVAYRHRGTLRALRARTAVMAGGSWTTRHVVRDLPDAHREAYAAFHRSPCLVANVALTSWRFLYDAGLHEVRWFEGIGDYTAVRKMAAFGPVAPAISPDSPVVLTLKILFATPGRPLEEQVARGRAELLSTPFIEYERRIREHLAAMFGPLGFDARRHIAGLVLNRWGHAYLSPQPGFFFGRNGRPGPGELLRDRPAGRVTFANSDLSGIMDHRASILEGRRAAQQALALLR